MAFRVAGVLEMLRDGEWHRLEDVRRELKLSRSQFRQVVEFLRDYEFVAVDEAGKRMRIEDSVRRFLAQEATS